MWGSEIELRAIFGREQMSQALQASFLGAQGHETLFAPDYMPFISTHYRSLSENIVQVTADGNFRSAMDSFAMDGSLGPDNLTAAGLTAPDFACTAEATSEWDVSKCVEGRWCVKACLQSSALLCSLSRGFTKKCHGSTCSSVLLNLTMAMTMMMMMMVMVMMMMMMTMTMTMTMTMNPKLWHWSTRRCR